MTDSVQSTAGLASLLSGRLQEWERSRKPQELKMLECYNDVMRIPRDNDTKGSGLAKSRKAAGLFVGSTRNKVRAARAKINDALFGNGLMPFDTTPTNEELKKYADTVEDIITEQLERMKFKDLLKTGVNTLATYGTGFIFGPFVRTETLTETYAENSAVGTQIKEKKYEFDFPYFELGNTLDVYPDPEARTIEDGLGVFWVTMESPHTVQAWKQDKSYSNIDDALQGAANNGNETGSEIAGQIRANVEFWHKNNRIKVARFFGKVPKSAMGEGDDPNMGAIDSGEMVDVVIIMAGGVVVKMSESPYGAKRPAHRCGYEEVEHEMWAVGVAENNAPHQKTVNAAFRLFMEGKGMALLGTKSVDRSMFLPTEDFIKSPGKTYQMKPGLSPDERKTAIIEHIEPDITAGWIDVIKMSEQFSDDDTGITKYTQGDDSSNLNKTATGISMIMSASSLPIKEVIQHIDSKWIEPLVECLIDWNLKYLEVETVQKIHGDEAAQAWTEIKQFGKASFMDWQATGTSSFMQKEVLTNKLRAFADFAMSNPATAPLIDARELLTQTWDCMEIGKESPILKEEGEQQIPPQIKMQMGQMKQENQMLNETLQEIGEKFNKLEADTEIARQKMLEDAHAAAEERKIKAYDTTTKRLSFLAPYLTPAMAMQLAVEVGLDVRNDPDLSMMLEVSQQPAGAAQPEAMEQEPPEPQGMEPQGQPEPPGPEEQMQQPEQPATPAVFTSEQPQEGMPQ